jgi:hypothetical protein
LSSLVFVMPPIVAATRLSPRWVYRALTLQSAGVRILRTASMRLFRTIKDECLSKMVFFGEALLRRSASLVRRALPRRTSAPGVQQRGAAIDSTYADQRAGHSARTARRAAELLPSSRELTTRRVGRDRGCTVSRRRRDHLCVRSQLWWMNAVAETRSRNASLGRKCQRFSSWTARADEHGRRFDLAGRILG